MPNLVFLALKIERRIFYSRMRSIVALLTFFFFISDFFFLFFFCSLRIAVPVFCSIGRREEGSVGRGAGQVSHKFKLATHFRTVCTAPQLHLSTSRTTAESQFFGLLNAPLKVFLFYYICLLLRFSAFFFLSFCFLLSFFISLFFSCILFLLRVILCSS